MSKPVKNMMIRDYQHLLDGVDNALLVSIRGIGAVFGVSPLAIGMASRSPRQPR